MSDTLQAVTNRASGAALDTVTGQASVAMLRKSLDLQASNAAQLIQSLPQTAPLASSGQLGTRLNAYA